MPMKLFTILLVVAGLAMAADKSEAVKAAEKSWASATIAGDEAKLKQVLADDLTYTHSSGDTDSKTVFIDNLKTGARKGEEGEYGSREGGEEGNTAILGATAN